MATEPNAAATPNPAEAQAPNILAEAGKEKPAAEPSVLSDAQKQAQEQQAAEEKRLLEADVNTLSEEDKTKRTGIEKRNEEKRLRETPDEQLSEEDKTKKQELLKADGKAKAAPDKYEFKLPEGMTLDQAFADKAIPVLKKAGISQETANELMALHIEHIQEIEKRAAATQEENWKKFNNESYEETIKALGANSKEELKYIAKLRDAFFSEETREILEASGVGNSKSFVFDMIKIGKSISDDKFLKGPAAQPTAGKSAAQIMYPEQGSKQ